MGKILLNYLPDCRAYTLRTLRWVTDKLLVCAAIGGSEPRERDELIAIWRDINDRLARLEKEKQCQKNS